ncbi:hypothetical protein [Fodinibius salsisoli]|uniref:Immunity protein 10 n=1 Tax=Fodinibius salsisoli TaxID=2820877 RepID=A0ABT3PMF6_9BACT|nr:hypothetical protein [Fodinibius salsisoli]MCW9707136.1 hypothetical protein [Fodinibius salsisoli]
MKQQTTVVITKVEIDGEVWPLDEPEDIELEFSAIDTGGGFHDPILDFAYELSAEEQAAYLQEDLYDITLYLQDPAHEENSLEVAYEGRLKLTDNDRLEGTGRLKDEDMSRDIVKFVIRSVRR